MELPIFSYETHKLIIENFNSICEFIFDLTIDDVNELQNNYDLLSNDKIILLGEHYLRGKYNNDMIDDIPEIYAINYNNEFVNLNYFKESAIMI